jgi:hypothetical protein
MTQHRIWDYHAPEDTELLNSRYKGIIRVGVHFGFEVENATAGFVNIREGVLVTADGVRIEETDDIINLVSIPPNNSGNPRVDYIVCRHKYVKTVPPPLATYSVIAGTPAASPEPPVLPDNAVILARGLLPDAATAYSEIKLTTPDEVFNAVFDGHDWRIIYGNKSAYRIEHDINDDSIRFYIIPASVYPDNEIINWGAPIMTLSTAGHEQLNAETAARQAADAILQGNIDTEAGIRAGADTTLQNNINSEASTRSSEDTALKNALADAKGRTWNENIPANEDMSEIASRLDSLEASGGVPAHRTRHEAGGDDIVRFDQLEDGSTYKKMLATERTKIAGIEANAEVNNLTDAQATDLSDGGDCTVHYHDGRYYTETEINTQMSGKAALGHNHTGAGESQVPEGGIANNAVTAAKIAAAVAGNGLSGGGGSALAVNIDGATLEIASDALRVKNGGITPAKTGFTEYFGQNAAVTTITGGGLGFGYATAVSPSHPG